MLIPLRPGQVICYDWRNAMVYRVVNDPTYGLAIEGVNEHFAANLTDAKTGQPVEHVCGYFPPMQTVLRHETRNGVPIVRVNAATKAQYLPVLIEDRRLTVEPCAAAVHADEAPAE